MHGGMHGCDFSRDQVIIQLHLLQAICQPSKRCDSIFRNTLDHSPEQMSFFFFFRDEEKANILVVIANNWKQALF